MGRRGAVVGNNKLQFLQIITENCMAWVQCPLTVQETVSPAAVDGAWQVGPSWTSTPASAPGAEPSLARSQSQGLRAGLHQPDISPWMGWIDFGGMQPLLPSVALAYGCRMILDWTFEGIYSLKGWLNIGMDCPMRCWRHRPWRFLRAWTWHSVSLCGSYGGLWSQAGLNDLTGLFRPNWFCDCLAKRTSRVRKCAR